MLKLYRILKLLRGDTLSLCYVASVTGGLIRAQRPYPIRRTLASGGSEYKPILLRSRMARVSVLSRQIRRPIWLAAILFPLSSGKHKVAWTCGDSLVMLQRMVLTYVATHYRLWCNVTAASNPFHRLNITMVEQQLS